MKLKSLLISFLLCGATFAQTFVENFNYGTTAGPLCGTGGVSTDWVPHSGAGTNPVLYATTSLSVTGYASNNVGGSATLAHGSGTREDINRQVFPVTSGSFYFTFLLNVSNSGGTTGDYMVHLSDLYGASIGSTFRARIFVKDGSVSNTFKLGISKGAAASGATFTTADYALNTSHVVIVKYKFNPSANDDSCNAWIYSTVPPSLEPAPMIAATDITATDLSSIQSICLRQGSTGTAAMTIDGGRLAFTWNDSALPIKWGSLNASKNNGNNIISWTTLSESNNSHFMVERSFDGKSFTSIGKVKGVGSSNKTTKYSYTDADVNQTAYYRLKQVDVDGSSDYSKTVSVKVAELEIGLAPNPFTDVLNIENKNNQNISVEVIDISGKTMLTASGNNNISVNTSGLANGIYFVKISNSNQTEVKRIYKN